jgi:site-specific DNA-methyltransferase (adenine-specific)
MHGVRKDMVVYDPFMGIGTTALACIRLGVNYLGTDIDAEYLKVAMEDIENRKKGVMDVWLDDKNNKVLFE